jgi:twitching motility two-component system response regulator PilH
LPKVLIGHPDKNFRYELHKSLSSSKYIVIEADNGGALFTITKTQQPHFVVAADGMPSLSTEDFLKKLREANLGHIPVIILTTRNNILRNLLLMEMGAKEVMQEPIREADLLFHLKRFESPFLPSQEKEPIEVFKRVEPKVDTPTKEPESRKNVNTPPESEPRNVLRSENSSLLLRQARCMFCKSNSMVKLFSLKTRTMLTEPNMFDVECYVNAIGNNEYCDYSLLEVGVCHNCFFATNDFRLFDIQGLRAEGTSEFSEFVYQAFQKKLDERKKLISRSSEKMFTEARTPEDAIIANDLATHFLSFLYEYDKLKYSSTQNEIFQYYLKSAAIAEKAQMLELRNKKILEAYQLGLMQMSLKGELGVRRHTVQMYALSHMLKIKESIKKYGRELFESLNKVSNNPQVRIKSREYADRAKKQLGWVEDGKYWENY